MYIIRLVLNYYRVRMYKTVSCEFGRFSGWYPDFFASKVICARRVCSLSLEICTSGTSIIVYCVATRNDKLLVSGDGRWLGVLPIRVDTPMGCSCMCHMKNEIVTNQN